MFIGLGIHKNNKLSLVTIKYANIPKFEFFVNFITCNDLESTLAEYSTHNIYVNNILYGEYYLNKPLLFRTLYVYEYLLYKIFNSMS